MSADDLGGYRRDDFLRRLAAFGVTLPLVANLEAIRAGVAQAASSDASTGTAGGLLSVGSTDWLPPNWFIGSSLSNALISFTQMAWGLFIGSGGRSLTYQNGLAADYQVSPSRLVHTIRLRPNMKFHDGSPIDANAVAANLKASFFKNSPLRDKGGYTQIAITLGDPPIVKSVAVRDSHTVVITLTQPRIDIKTALAFTPILNPRIMAHKDYGTNVKLLGQAGSGPFRLTSFQPGSFAEFERFDGFFEKVLPDRVRVSAYTDSGPLALALKSGQLHVAEGLGKPDWDALSRSGFQQIISDPAAEADLLLGWPKDKAFADRRVRVAMGMAMNRASYAQAFYDSGTARVSTNPIVDPGMAGYVKTAKRIPYNPTAAQALMKAAGVSSARLSMQVPTVQTPTTSNPNLAQAIAADLAKIGITVNVQVMDPATWGNTIVPKKYESTLVSPGGQPDPFILFDLFFRSIYEPGFLPQASSIPKELTAAHAAKTVAQRDRHLRNVIKATLDHALIIPIAAAGYCCLAQKRIRNFPLTGTALDSWHRVTGF